MPLNVIAQLTREFPFGSNDNTRCIVCHLFGVIQNTFFLLSVYSVTLLSLDRLLYVKRPLKYAKTVTVRRTILILLFCWLLSFLLSSLPLFGVGLIDFGDLLAACSVGYDLSAEDPDYVYFLSMIAGICVVPMCVLLVSNIWLLCIIRKKISKGYHRSILDASASSSLTLRIIDENKQKHLRLTQIFGVIFMTSIVTWTPTLVSIILLTQIILPAYIVFAHICLLSQVVIHPVVQVILLKDIRDEITRCCRCYSCKGRVLCKDNKLCLCVCGLLNTVSAAVTSDQN